MHGGERFRDDRICKSREQTFCSWVQPRDFVTEQFQKSEFHEAAHDEFAARSWMLTFGVIHLEQLTDAPRGLLVSPDMDKRWKKAPQKSFVRCIKDKAATSEHNARPRSFAKYKLGTSRRCDDGLTVFRLKLWIRSQRERRRGPNESEVSGLQVTRSSMWTR
jgi:hypothetical protein